MIGSQVPRVGFQVPRAGSQVPKVKSQVPRVGSQVPRVGSRVPTVRSQVSIKSLETPEDSQFPTKYTENTLILKDQDQEKEPKVLKWCQGLSFSSLHFSTP